MAFAMEESNRNLAPGACDQQSFPVHDLRRNLEAVKKSVVGEVAADAC